MSDRVAQLLAKLCAKGPSAGVGGGTGWDAMEVSSLMAGCYDPAYYSVLAKYTEDKMSEEFIIRLLGHLLRPMSKATGREFPFGYEAGAQQAAKVAFNQYFDGYRCNHCGGKGEEWGEGGVKPCGNCNGTGGGCFSDGFKLRAMNTGHPIEGDRPWLLVIEKGEEYFAEWDSEAVSHLEWKLREAKGAA